MGKYTGHRFGHLVAGEHISRGRYAFICDCGVSTTKDVQNQKALAARGGAPHCGCRNKDTLGKNRRTHGGSKHPLYSRWAGIKHRCAAPNHPGFHRYGGRGITVCEEWADDFQQFVRDMGPSYSPGLTIDRIDNDKGYSPANCHWVDNKANNRNRGNHTYIDSPWGRITQAEAAERLGLTRATMLYRTRKWPPERWFEQPHTNNRKMEVHHEGA